MTPETEKEIRSRIADIVYLRERGGLEHKPERANAEAMKAEDDLVAYIGRQIGGQARAQSVAGAVDKA